MGFRPTSDSFPLLVVLNPHSGKKQGAQVLETLVKPALAQANKPFRLIETSSQGHAQSYFKDNIQPILIDLVQSLSTIDEATQTVTPPKSAVLQVLVLGGDGTVHEIVNGVLTGLEGTAFISDAFRPRVEFAILPTGTGNAISTSLGVKSAQEGLGRFLAGKAASPLKVMTVSTRDGTKAEEWKTQVYTIVVNSFGLHCATVYDSEEFRHLGNERFRTAAMKNIENLKQYEGQLDLFGPVQKYDPSSKALVAVPSTANTANAGVATVSLKGPFTYLLLSKQASLEPGFTPTPFADTSDEWLDILAVQNVDQAKILAMFGETGTGKHVDQDSVEYYKAKTAELETPQQGRLCIDGEFLTIEAGPKGKVRIEVAADAGVQLFGVYA